MANTYAQIYLQIEFAVQGREARIHESFRDELQMYMSGIISKNGQKLYAIYCMPDHTHILISYKPGLMLIADLVRDIKSCSTAFLKSKGFVRTGFSWQSGYGVFSYHKELLPIVTAYILNQPAHHEKKKFQQEYLEFLNEFEIEYNERYLFEFYE
ncbi:MAG TPA: transposase [Chitinophagaceae bacterium]|nr:transposase [Chitinophagaceae bacterium]